MRQLFSLLLFSFQISHAGILKFDWSEVNIGGGGYISGIITHPKEKDLIYARTDVGGALRWDPRDRRWVNLSTWLGVTDHNLYGVESLAIDPNNPDIVYMACGKEHHRKPEESDILKSLDRGKTWKKLGIHIYSYGNGPVRYAGERLVVDPADSNRIYYGTRNDGLWASGDAGEKWERVESFPVTGKQFEGLGFVEIHEHGPEKDGRSQVIYVSALGDGLYKTEDGAATWKRIEGGPEYMGYIRNIEIAKDGTVYATFEAKDWKGGVWKLSPDDTWTDIAPLGKQIMRYNALALDPTDNSRILAMTYWGFGSNSLYSSTDGGATWKDSKYTLKKTTPWRPDNWSGSQPSCVKIDPHDPRRAYFSCWYAFYETQDIGAVDRGEPVVFTDHTLGHEELVAMSAHSPVRGAPLITGVADVGGFRHADTKVFPKMRITDKPQSNEVFVEDITSISSSIGNPDFIALVGGNKLTKTGNGGYSMDNGVTWKAFPNKPLPGSHNGRIAVAKDASSIVWIPQIEGKRAESSQAYFSRDKGVSWTASEGSPQGVMERGEVWSWDQPLVSDKAAPRTFYIYNRGKIHVSKDGGKTFAATAATLPDRRWWENYRLTAGAGGGELWMAFPMPDWPQGGNGLFHSTDGGVTFAKVATVDEVILMDTGIGPAPETPAHYLLGKVGGEFGMFLSLDRARTWTKVSDASQQFGNLPSTLTASQSKFGEVYVGFAGGGFVQGHLLAE